MDTEGGDVHIDDCTASGAHDEDGDIPCEGAEEVEGIGRIDAGAAVDEDNIDDDRNQRREGHTEEDGTCLEEGTARRDVERNDSRSECPEYSNSRRQSFVSCSQ